MAITPNEAADEAAKELAHDVAKQEADDAADQAEAEGWDPEDVDKAHREAYWDTYEQVYAREATQA